MENIHTTENEVLSRKVSLSDDTISGLFGYSSCKKPGNAHPDDNDGGMVFPLVTGVTGHRHLRGEEIPGLKERTRRFFTALCAIWKQLHHGRKVFRGCSLPPILVLNGLAKGADQLVACVVQEMQNTMREDCPLKLVATLPMPYEIYAQDFPEASDERRQFEELWKSADARITLPLTQANLQKVRQSGAEPSFRLSAEDRQSQYQQLGEYLVTNAFLLLALWDGDSSDRRPGGTSDVVYMKRYGSDVPTSEDGESAYTLHPDIHIQPFGVVCRIPASRKNGLKVNETTYDWYLPSSEQNETSESEWQTTPGRFFRRPGWIYRLESMIRTLFSQYPTRFEGIVTTLDHLAEMNCDAALLFTGVHKSDRQVFSFREQYRKSRACVIPDECMADKSESLRFLRNRFGLADAMSGYFQSRYIGGIFRWYLCLLFLVSLFFSLKIYGRATSRAIIDIFSYGYWAILFGFFLIYFYESFSARYYDRYHRYRAFAEGLRVQIGWLLAGIQRPVMDHYWNHQISELDWLRMTLRSVMIPFRYDGHVFISQSREYWLKSQRDWMCGRIFKQRQVSRRHERIAWIFIGLALLWSIARIRIAELMNTFYGMCDILWCRLLVSSLIVIFSLSGVIAAIGFLYTQGRSRSDAQRYRKLVPLYSQYLQAMARAEQRITDPVQQQ